MITLDYGIFQVERNSVQVFIGCLNDLTFKTLCRLSIKINVPALSGEISIEKGVSVFHFDFLGLDAGKDISSVPNLHGVLTIINRRSKDAKKKVFSLLKDQK